jgi:hypothetical protein
MNDLDLLRKFEPVVCFTDGELFFPCAVDEYIKRCSLWLRNGKSTEEQLADQGELTTENLARFREVPADHTLYLRFVEQPMDPIDYQHWQHRPDKPTFVAPGRLARVGLLARILDSVFDLSFIIRGNVPGGTTAVADVKYRHMRRQDPRFVYYGRVIREGGYIVLHYLFFYAMNNWRSSFYGVNDHEADWEQVFVYLTDEAVDEPVPVWSAYASHDFSGDDLRRRWDDPELDEFDGSHPLVYAGAGSHASYFLPGEYLMNIEPEFLRPVKNAVMALRKFWTDTLGQGESAGDEDRVETLLSVPFVDYARGDGIRIGPGQEYGWSPILLTKDMGWVEDYRGLWGLDTQDPFGGERAPAGPKYNRDGSVRTTWYDPLGWAGLDKVPPPDKAETQLRKHLAVLTQQQQALEPELVRKRDELRQLSLEVQALHETDYLNYLYRDQLEKLNAAQAELQSLYAQYSSLAEAGKATQSYLTKIERGILPDPQAHIGHKHLPEPPADEQARIAELWAAVSGGLLLLVYGGLMVLIPSRWLAWTILVGIVFFAIEAAIRGRLANFLLNITVILAVITGAILVVKFWWVIALIILFVVVFVMIRDNLRELWTH